MIRCRRMSADLVSDARSILGAFLEEDEFYLDSSAVYGDGGERALDRALELFLARPDLGFVWLAYDGDTPAGVCVISLAISTSVGGLVAKLDDCAQAHRVDLKELCESRSGAVVLTMTPQRADGRNLPVSVVKFDRGVLRVSKW